MPSAMTLALSFTVGLLLGIGAVYAQPVCYALAVIVTMVGFAAAEQRHAEREDADYSDDIDGAVVY